MDLSSKYALFYDHGLFTYAAERLAREDGFGKVGYFTPWKVAFPKSNNALFGQGLTGVTRVDNFFDEVKKADIVIFPDIYDGDLQEFLRDEMGKVVWGGGRTDELEYDRWEFRKLQQKLGMATPYAKLVIGIDALREELKGKTDLYVKVNKYRGDVESFHHENENLSDDFLDVLSGRLGAKKNEIKFIVEKPIGKVEVGYDGWCIDGQFPEIAAYGYEIKDQAYIGKIGPYKDFPAVLTKTNGQLASTFKERKMRGWYSSEVRVDEKKVGYMIDPCMRMGAPPGEAMVEAYSNIAEIVWEGAQGNLVAPKPVGKYCAIALGYSSYADKNWMTLEVDKKEQQWLKIRCETRIKGKSYYVPQASEAYTVAAAVAIGNTVKEVIETVKKRAEMIKALELTMKDDALDDAEEVIAEGKKVGIEF